MKAGPHEFHAPGESHERQCFVCVSPRCAEIDQALIAGQSVRECSRRFAIGKTSIHRHLQKHLRKDLEKANEERRNKFKDLSAEAILKRCANLYRKIEAILRMGERSGNPALQLAAIREARGTLELLAKLSAFAFASGARMEIPVNVDLDTQMIETINPADRGEMLAELVEKFLKRKAALPAPENVIEVRAEPVALVASATSNISEAERKIMMSQQKSTAEISPVEATAASVATAVVAESAEDRMTRIAQQIRQDFR